MHRQRMIFVMMLVAAVTSVLCGCFPQDVGVTLMASPSVLDFGEGKDTLDLKVSRSVTTTPSGPVVVSSSAAWLVLGDCLSPQDECYARSFFSPVNIPVTIRRELMTLGTNRATIYVDASASSRLEVEVVAEDVLQPDFTTDERAVDFGRPILFQDASVALDSLGPVAAWQWTFGDGQTSTETNPTHLYTQPGAYDVSLKVRAGNVEETVTKTAFVRVGDPQIHADFTASETNLMLNGVVSFTDLSSSDNTPLTTWNWDFGDGVRSTDRNPYHQYNKAGLYTVTLTAGTRFGSSSKVRENYINVRQKQGPSADFAASTTMVYRGAPVRFTDLSDPGTSSITDWVWEFGDQFTSNEKNPTHSFNNVGVFDVKLTVYTAEGVDSKVLPVTVDYKPPTAAFDANNLNPSVDEAIQFNDRSELGSAPIAHWLWSFGDGGTSNGKNPLHVYTKAGVYTVSLTVTTSDPANNQDVETKDDYITVVLPPKPDFEWTPLLALTDQKTSFSSALTVAGSEPITGYRWDFDGNSETVDDQRTGPSPQYTFTTPGNYRVKLIVATATREVSIQKNVLVDKAPSADFTASLLTGITIDDIQFTVADQPVGARPISRYLWNFGDGATSTAAQPTHRYASVGSYRAKLTVFFRHTASAPADPELSVTVDKPGYITITPPVPPTATFAPDNACGLTGLTTTFTVTAYQSPSRPIVKWEWNFGDGTPLYTQNGTAPAPAQHTYAAAGDYNVKLTVTAKDLSPADGVRTFSLAAPYSIGTATDLDTYVRFDDGAYDFDLVNTFQIKEGGKTLAKTYAITMTSQQWRTTADIYEGDGVQRTLWKHPVVLIDPVDRVSDTAILFINGGSRSSTLPNNQAEMDEYLWYLAVLSGCPVALLSNVPSQPMIFTDEVTTGTSTEEGLILRQRSEDEIIAYTYNKYMETHEAGSPDSTWPLLFPMAKAAVKAMDTVQTVLGPGAGFANRPVKDFVVTGASKRGWTTWLTGVADCRAKAIAPIVIDVLNMSKQMEHHRKAYGYWSPWVYDYAQERVFDRLVPETEGGALLPEAEALLKLVDPYEYAKISRLDMPKYLMNGTQDEFFLPDASQWYFEGLTNEKYLNYIPNGDHGLVDDSGIDPTNSENPAGNLLGWIMSVTQNKPRPEFTTIVDRGAGKITVKVADADKNRVTVKMWSSDTTASGVRDFRRYQGPPNSVTPPVWRPRLLTADPSDSTGTTYVAAPQAPTNGGYMGFFIQVVYPNRASLPPSVASAGLGFEVPDLTFTTDVLVIPNNADGTNLYPPAQSYDARDKFPAYFSGDVPIIRLSGTPSEMGEQYGSLMAGQIASFIPGYISSFQASVPSATNAVLDNDWAVQSAKMDPRIVEEIDGIATGAAINVTLLRRAHMVAGREALANWTSAGTAAWRKRTDTGNTMQAVTINGPITRSWLVGGATHYVQDYACVVAYVPNRGVPHAVLTYAGLAVGRTGVNLGGITFSEVVDDTSSAFANANLNFAFIGREMLYDSMSFAEAKDFLIKPGLRPQCNQYFVVSDGRNQRRGCVITAGPNADSAVLSYNRSGSIDTNNPLVSGMVFKAKPSFETDYMSAVAVLSRGGFNEFEFYSLSESPYVVEANRNALNVVYNCSEGALEVTFSYASGVTQASASPVGSFDLQYLMP